LLKKFNFCDVNTFGVPKFSKLRFAFIIFAPIPVKEMVYLSKRLSKRSSQWTFQCGKPWIKNRIWKNSGEVQPLSLLDPPM